MKYAVIYQSKSGNTRFIAEKIFEQLAAPEKELCDIDKSAQLPVADMYFVGFGVHNESCSMDMIDCMELLEGMKFALFVTCGFVPSDQYKAKLEKMLEVWFPENAEYLGMYLCQGKVEKKQQQTMIEEMPEAGEQLQQLFLMGSSHPDEEDIRMAGEFAASMQRQAEEG